MAAAARPRDPYEDRLLVVDTANKRIEERTTRALPSLLRAGDLLVVNDAATRASLLPMRTVDGAPVEVRLVDEKQPGEYDAILFGPGSWRDDTDHRPPPPVVEAGDVLVHDDARARVVAVSRLSPRRITIAVDDALLGAARPIQYSYLADDLRLDEVQTPYASRAWAAEMPSAGRTLTVGLLVELRRRGVGLARVTAAAGISATGDPALDRMLPFPERVEVPDETLDAILATRARGGRVIAVGTSTVRALESAGAGELERGHAVARLVLGPGYVPRLVDGILSGMHEAGTSHDALLRAFACGALVDELIARGRAAGFLLHELGDHCLLLPDVLSDR
jgi:S-adenosylmethionine:tRNA ribosyltransferase-isomerase